MQEKKSTVGGPIWVESLMTPMEYREAARKYPSSFSKGSSAPQYNSNDYDGGTWRQGMGSGYTPEEIRIINKRIDDLHNLLGTKGFKNMKGQYGDAKLQ